MKNENLHDKQLDIYFVYVIFFQINRRTKNSELRCLTLNNVIAARRETRDALTMS